MRRGQDGNGVRDDDGDAAAGVEAEGGVRVGDATARCRGRWRRHRGRVCTLVVYVSLAATSLIINNV
jgi:hypothetical protein